MKKEKVKKERIVHYDSAACYPKVSGKILMLQYNKKWGQVYTPPGGKFETGETPLDCVVREFKEETGLNLIDPKLQGISCWKDSCEGIIYIFTAEAYSGELRESEEGRLSWIEEENLKDLRQFSQNQKFMDYLFQPEIFEGKFELDENCNVVKYEIRTI